jgi:transcriptional regulator with XRE-family HTH domain
LFICLADGRSLSAAAKSPNPVDKHVGARIRMQRRVLRVTQEKLADALELALAQVRKYEAGTNRVSASRLQQIALALKVTPAFFFENAPALKTGAPKTGTRLTPQVIALSRAFAKINDGRLRHDIITLVEGIARRRR